MSQLINSHLLTRDNDLANILNSQQTAVFPIFIITRIISICQLGAFTVLPHCILLSPGSSSGLILGSIRLIHVSNLGNKRIIRIWVGQQRTYGEQHLQMKAQILKLILISENNPTILINNKISIDAIFTTCHMFLILYIFIFPPLSNWESEIFCCSKSNSLSRSLAINQGSQKHSA